MKAADTMSAYMKALYEVHAGNEEFRVARDSIRVKLETLHMPEVDKFLEDYVPALTKSLDQLNYYDIKK